jgi:hypothetical protein
MSKWSSVSLCIFQFDNSYVLGKRADTEAAANSREISSMKANARNTANEWGTFSQKATSENATKCCRTSTRRADHRISSNERGTS